MSIAVVRGASREREIVDLLVNAGASLEVRDRFGRTAADYAKSADNTALQSYIEQLKSTQKK